MRKGVKTQPNLFHDRFRESSTGKKVYKREATTHALLGTWDTIAKAADSENCSAAKMSRCVKNKTVIQDYYFTVDT
jgi:hypothetical protein